MHIASLLALVAFAPAPDSLPPFNGRAGDIRVPIPRVEARAVPDGWLDEAVWAQAAVLTGFSQYQPVDGRPAEETTEVLVWYAPDAIWFGIRAREAHGNVVRATRANRDNIGSEDHVQVLLDTNNDRRLAFVFGVNALGVQQDGTRSDQYGGGAGGFSATGGGTRDINPMDGNVDLNPDYVFQSGGRLVKGGYEVEIRIPFKSLRYQEGNPQDWGINVIRRVQHSGYEDTWTPAIRASASFLAQSGTLEGLHDLRRGLVLEVTPTLTGRLDGAPGPTGISGTPEGWDYDGVGEASADIRWGLRQNLTLNGTWNPDFSQVEADVGQVLINERFALFYPEKRPFFLDGLELFDTPNQLIYTRQIQQPRGGVKLGGKLGPANVSALVAGDDPLTSWSGGHTPVFGIARVRGDLGKSNTIGAVLTSRKDGSDFSRLAGADLRLYHSKLYYVELQAVQSWSDSAGRASSGPLFQATWDRTGRAWGFHFSGKAVAPDFRAAAGFVNRTGVVDLNAFNRFSFYGAEDALVQTWGAFIGLNRLFDYDALPDGAIEGSESLSPSATLRGGWRLNGRLIRAFYSYEPDDYGSYGIETGSGAVTDTAAFIVPGPDRNLWSGSVGFTTPTYRIFTLTMNVGWGETPIFREAAPGRSRTLTGTVDVRPLPALRTSLQLGHQRLDRARDGSTYSTETIPRLKVEYQLTPAIFFRVVGQYAARERAALEDRNGNPILVEGVKDTGSNSNEFRMDWLFSYRPVPGTLFYFGYGSTLTEPDQFAFRNLTRSVDGFFAKASYVFRL
jgi:hypothetical protein